jgi:nucleotide-binding universal stress UspA family protein
MSRRSVVVIVVGHTQRPESRAALEWAVAEASRRSAKLHIVRVMPDATTAESESLAKGWSEAMGAARREGVDLEGELGERGIEASVEVVATPGDVAARLLDAAERLEAALVVIGMRRRSPVGKLVLGSVAQDVLLNADCPVVAVKADVAD